MRNFRKNNGVIRRTIKWLAVLMAMVLGITVAGILNSGYAGVPFVPCDTPSVFSGAAVNAVILDYTYVGTANQELSETAHRLALLIQMEILYSILKYGSIGATHLKVERDSQGCDPDTILAKLLGKAPGAKGEIEPGKALVFLWGHIYEEDEDIYVQSYLQFLRRDVRDTLLLSLDIGTESSFDLIGKLPAQSVAFAPQRLSARDLHDIEEEYRLATIIRDQPHDSSRGRRIPVEASISYAYQVLETRGDWIKIDMFEGEIIGWIHAQSRIGGSTLSERMPELDFADAAVGYLRYRVSQDGTVPADAPGRIIRRVKQALDRFESKNDPRRAPLAAAMSEILYGAVTILNPRAVDNADMVRAAQSRFAHAVKLIPYSADARNLEAMAQIYLNHHDRWAAEGPGIVEKDLLQGIAADPANEDVVSNLETLHLLVNYYDSLGVELQGEGLTRELNAIRKVRAYLKEQR